MFGISRNFEIEFSNISAAHGRFIAFIWLSWNTVLAVYQYSLLISKTRWAASMPGIAPAMKAEMPEVISAARVRNVFNAAVSKTQDQSFQEIHAFYADPEIFDILPFAEFNYRYMEDAYNSFYLTEVKIRTLIRIFTCLALLVSCLGLFGLAAFTASKRVKEIGIRKVLGATASGITVLLSKQFAQWVIISNVAAWPIAYYLLNRWLDNFAFRISLGPLPFIISGAVALSTAIVTVSFLTIKAAVTNPVESLKYE